jgi:hypothetical protein
MKRPYRIMLQVPDFVNDNLDMFDDREIVLISFIMTIHKIPHYRKRDRTTVYNMSNRDFQNILGWKSFMTDVNLKAEALRTVFKIGMHGSHWSIQWLPHLFTNKKTNMETPPGKLVYLTDPKAIAMHYYIQSRLVSSEVMHDYVEGMDMEELYKKPLLGISEYKFLKLRYDLY